MDPLTYRKHAPTPEEQVADLGLFAMTDEAKSPANPDWLIAPMSPIEHAFQAFHAENPGVYELLEGAALAAHTSGARRLGIAKLVEDIRYRSDVRTAGDAFKMNNNFRALYARLLIHRHPELEAVLSTRERRERGAA